MSDESAVFDDPRPFVDQAIELQGKLSAANTKIAELTRALEEIVEHAEFSSGTTYEISTRWIEMAAALSSPAAPATKRMMVPWQNTEALPHEECPDCRAAGCVAAPASTEREKLP